MTYYYKIFFLHNIFHRKIDFIKRYKKLCILAPYKNVKTEQAVLLQNFFLHNI